MINHPYTVRLAKTLPYFAFLLQTVTCDRGHCIIYKLGAPLIPLFLSNPPSLHLTASRTRLLYQADLILSSRPFYILFSIMNPKSISSSRFKQLPRESPLSHFLSRHDDLLYSGFITRLDRSPVRAKR